MMYSTIGAPGIRPLRSPARPEFFHRFEAEFVVRPVTFTPDGLRFEAPFDGRVTRGAFVGHRVQGVDQLLLRPDGVVVLDLVKTISGVEQQVVEHVRGYAIPPADLDLSIDDALEPGFAWPDASFAIVGSAMFRASGELGEHINRSVAVVEGWCNFAAGSLAVETRLVPINQHVAGPRVAQPTSRKRFTVDEAVTGKTASPPLTEEATFELLAPAVPIADRPTESEAGRAVA